MAVLVEAISVIVLRDAVDRRFPGGWPAFRRKVPNRSLCFDRNLVRVGFMTPEDAGAFTSTLQAVGLLFQSNGEAVDFAVVDQLKGPTVRAPWLEFGKLHDSVMTISVCWLAGQPAGDVSFPVGWEYQGSLSAEPEFVANEEVSDRLKFLRREGKLDVYLDLRTGEEMFVGRPTVAGDTEAAIATQLENLFYEALRIESEMDRQHDEQILAASTARLSGELLREAEQIAFGPGHEMWFAYFVRGLILRILGRLEEATASFRTAELIQSGKLNTLRELVLCLGELGSHAEALPFARRAVEVAPDDAGAWGNLAITLLRCGERVEARSAIDQAIQLDPNDSINRRILENFDTL